MNMKEWFKANTIWIVCIFPQ